MCYLFYLETYIMPDGLHEDIFLLFSSVLKQVPIHFSCSGERCKADLL